MQRYCLLAGLFWLLASLSSADDKPRSGRFLYVATPGVRNYLDYGGHGLLVFDIERQHRFVKRIPTGGLDADGKPINVKGICASAATARVYISTIKTMMCLDLISEKLLWERAYDGGCDRMSISPDGKVIYLPSFEKDHWHVVDGASGDMLATITPKSKAHNTVYGPDGKWCYLAGLGSPLLTIADTSKHEAARTVGPFTAAIRPFTVNGRQSLAFCCVNELLGFEIGDIQTGKLVHRVTVNGYQKGPVKRHGCPSHGIGLTPDEKEVWVCDAHNKRMHVFDATVMPPQQTVSLAVRDEPGWITFSIDGKLAWPSSGEVIEVATKKIVATLEDEVGRHVGSEKLLEINFKDGQVTAAGNQFGVGAVDESLNVSRSKGKP